MGRLVATAASLAALVVALFVGASAQADEYKGRVQRHHAVRHVHQAGCERVVVRETGYRYYRHAQIYSWEPQEYTRVYCGRPVAMN